MSVEQQTWAADPHQFGPGKTHVVDDKDAGRTMCGKFLAAMPGKLGGKANCKICLNAVVSRPEQERNSAMWRQKHEDEQRARAEEHRQWMESYSAYLRTPEWAAKSRRVIARANGICEGCGVARATQAHHTTYDHVGAEFLWELRAVCHGCHERFHEKKI